MEEGYFIRNPYYQTGGTSSLWKKYLRFLSVIILLRDDKSYNGNGNGMIKLNSGGKLYGRSSVYGVRNNVVFCGRAVPREGLTELTLEEWDNLYNGETEKKTQE